ncbi:MULTISPECIES: hypothetical protein [unclassified Synechocystis]|nr:MULTISPECIES: hypothetical protein [unclassified Synechocystis]
MTQCNTPVSVVSRTQGKNREPTRSFTAKLPGGDRRFCAGLLLY